MLGRVKLFFGIEGIKVDLDIPVEFRLTDKVIEGVLRLHSKSAQTLKTLEIKLVETYQRGRGKEKRTNEYIWGRIEWNESLYIPALGEKIIDFRLPVTPQLSGMDEMAGKSIVHRKIASLATMLKNASSQFHVEVSTRIEGTALNPTEKKEIKLIRDGK
ncbi:MAG: hypothetical protein SH818_18025 [Saprospiraceae bacterium]|nr:hypothetical protein [Saprospiraceae bacterium]